MVSVAVEPLSEPLSVTDSVMVTVSVAGVIDVAMISRYNN